MKTMYKIKLLDKELLSSLYESDLSGYYVFKDIYSKVYRSKDEIFSAIQYFVDIFEKEVKIEIKKIYYFDKFTYDKKDNK